MPGRVWVVHLRVPGFAGEIIPDCEIQSGDAEFGIVPIGDQRSLVIRVVFNEMSLGTDGLESSLRDAVEMFDLQRH